MKSSKTFNNISTKLQQSIPKLKKGEVVLFQMLNGVKNNDPDEKERQKSPVLYGKVQVRTNLRIYDPFQDEIKDENGKVVDYSGGYVDIGCVDQWNGDTPTKFRFFVPGMKDGSRFQGKFQLVGGNVKDEELYEILWLSPEREGSLCADSAIQPLFKIVDQKADSKSSVTKVDRLRRALDIVKEITEADALRVMRALNQPTYQDWEVLRAKVSELAKDNVELFIATYESPDSYIKADIREAIERGIVKYEIRTGEAKIGDLLVATLKANSTDSFVESFTRWINTAENGQDVIANIRSQLGNKPAVNKEQPVTA